MSDCLPHETPPDHVGYTFACADVKRGYVDPEEEHAHDFATVVWNGERDTADPLSMDAADRYLAAKTSRCRCGQPMVVVRREVLGRGGESDEYRRWVSRRDVAAQAEALKQTQAIAETLASLHAIATMQAGLLRNQQSQIDVLTRLAAPTAAHAELLRHQQAQIDLLTRLAAPAPASPPAPVATLWSGLEADARDAAWRVAGAQFLALVREPFAALLQRGVAPDDAGFRARAAAFLETELGAALLAVVLSAALGALPEMGGTPTRLARELRVRGLAGAGDALAELVTGPLRAVVAEQLRGAPTPHVPAALGAGDDVLSTLAASETKEKRNRCPA